MKHCWQVFLLSFALSIEGGEASPLSGKDLNEGKRLYVLKCSKCHKFYDPANYSDAEWETWMEKMVKKSHLKEKQARLVQLYAELLRQEEGGLNSKAQTRNSK